MKSCFLLELFWKKLIFLGLLADFHFSNNLVDIFLSFSSLSLFLAWLFKLLKVLLYLLTDDCHKFIHIWFQVSHGIYHIWLFITQSSTHNFFSSYCHLYVTFIDACFFSVPLGSHCVHMLIVCPSAIWRSTIWSAKHPCHLSCSNLPLRTSPASPASCCKTTDMRCLSVNIQPPHSLYCIFFAHLIWWLIWRGKLAWKDKKYVNIFICRLHVVLLGILIQWGIFASGMKRRKGLVCDAFDAFAAQSGLVCDIADRQLAWMAALTGMFSHLLNLDL